MSDKDNYSSKTKEDLVKEIVELQLKLEEAEETLKAIQNGEIDAIVTQGPEKSKIYTLESADYLYRVLVQEMNEGVATLTSEGTIFYSNTQLASLLKIPLEQLIGQKLSEFIYPDDLEEFHTIFSEGLIGKRKGEINLKSVDGTLIPVLISIKTANNLKGVYAVITDLSEQKYQDQLKKQRDELLDLNEALIESERKYHDLVETNVDFVWEMDSHGLYTYCSPQMETLWGIKPEDMIGHTPFDLMPPDIRVDWIETFAGMIKSPEPFSGLESISYDDQGNKIYVETNGVPIFNDDGVFLGYRGITRDITERKQAENDLKEMFEKEQQLREELQSSNEELHTSTEELQAVNEELQNASENLQGVNELLQNQQDELKEANKNLKESEERFSKAFYTNPIALSILKPDGQIIDVNKKFADLTEFNTDELIGHTCVDLNIVNQDFHAKRMSEIQKMGSVYDLEAEIQTKNDEKRFALNTIQNIVIDDKLRLLDAFIDITERKQAEKELRRSEERYRNIIENIQDAYFRADKEGKIIMASPSAASMLGFNLKELIGLNAKSRYKNDEDREYVLEELNKHGKLIDNELELVKKDGTLIIVSQNAQYYYDNEGQIQGTETFLRDITHHKKAEQALQESEEKFSKAFRNSPNAITITRLSDGKIIEGNESAYELFGYSHDEVIGKTTNDLNIWANPDDRQKLVEGLASKGFIKNEEYVLQKKDQSHVYVNLSAAPINLNEEKCFLTSFIDITKRKQAENELKLRSEELIKSNADLKQFAYVTSHDLREPLRMITTFLQLLERRYKDQLDKDANEFIGFAVDGAKRLDKMIIDLLEYSRLANKKIEFTVVDTQEVIDHLLSNLSVLIKENNAQIIYESLPFIQGDKNLISILFQNLISNAIKYRREETPQIHISAVKEENQDIFIVKDNGIGIDPQHLERIFTIFKRLHTHEEYEGSGIGLSIAQRIVHQHGGEIWAKSEPGNGSTFKFTIPKHYIHK